MPASQDFAGIRVDTVNRDDVLAHIERAVTSGTGGNIANVNVHAINTAWTDDEFRRFLNEADLVFVDGFGVQLGARLCGMRFGERLTPADWIDDLLEACVRHQWPIFWLGDTDEVGEAFERRLCEKYPSLRFAGRHHGFFQREGAENDAIIKQINASGAKILMVGMSMPIQEKWIWANRHRLKPSVRLAFGGLARIVTGHIRRGPSWMTQHGLEWLYRLCVQPSYTWRRYLLGNPLFILRVLKWKYLGTTPRSR